MPRERTTSRRVRTMLSTGSPLAPESFDLRLRADQSRTCCLSSISGGTDIISCFALGKPILPVWRGELQCRGLGMAVEVCDEDGRPVRGEKGELVCVRPFPSMPIGFWNDPDGAKYRAAYFERFPGVWCHGDYAELTEHDGLVIYGRSDAVLNPGGVRIGTAEIYRQVEQLDEVLESLVIAQDWENDVRVVLFVRLRDGVTLDDALATRISDAHPREHDAAPRAGEDRAGRATFRARRAARSSSSPCATIVHGRPVKNVEALANPEALEHFRDRVELKS